MSKKFNVMIGVNSEHKVVIHPSMWRRSYGLSAPTNPNWFTHIAPQTPAEAWIMRAICNGGYRGGFTLPRGKMFHKYKRK